MTLGNYKVGEKWKICPWCKGELPSLYLNKRDEETYHKQHTGVEYATGVFSDSQV